MLSITKIYVAFVMSKHGALVELYWPAGENWSTWSKTCPNATLSTTHLTWYCLELSQNFHG
jgi:hypothetical protein